MIIREKRAGKNAEKSDPGLTLDINSELSWKEWAKPQKPSISTAGF